MNSNKPKFRSAVAFMVFIAFACQNLNAALVINSAQSITHQVTVQPIQVGNGVNTATVLGNASQQSLIEGFIDQIWAQVGIDIEWNSVVSYENSFAFDGNGANFSVNARPVEDLSTIVNAATTPPKNADAQVINMFFVEVVPGFAQQGENTANGLAFIGGNGITQYVGNNLLSFENGQIVIAHVVAHEIGHNLGLEHLDSDLDNLMHTGGSADPGDRLTAEQKTTVLSSALLVAVPEPHEWASVFGLMALGIVILKRREKSKAA